MVASAYPLGLLGKLAAGGDDDGGGDDGGAVEGGATDAEAEGDFSGPIAPSPPLEPELPHPVIVPTSTRATATAEIRTFPTFPQQNRADIA
jgi:hypothetical protein